MIIVSGTVRIRPEARDAAVLAASVMMEATREELGCRAYRFSFDVTDPTLVYVYEEWESAEALDRHFQTPHMAAFQQELPALLAGAPAIARFEATPVA
jgi:quinol monooxygenase YgiN